MKTQQRIATKRTFHFTLGVSQDGVRVQCSMCDTIIFVRMQIGITEASEFFDVLRTHACYRELLDTGPQHHRPPLQ